MHSCKIVTLKVREAVWAGKPLTVAVSFKLYSPTLVLSFVKTYSYIVAALKVKIVESTAVLSEFLRVYVFAQT